MAPITLTCADYARIMPLATGAVKADGIDLRLALSERGSWPGRAEMLRRALQDPTVQGGEASMGVHLKRMDQGDRSFVALPIFVLRNFTARDLYIRKDAPFRSAADLAGKRIGMYSWTASGSIWYRHFLRHCGLDIGAIDWTIGEVDGLTRTIAGLPDHVHAAPEGRSLADMLVAGELDAIYSPPRPRFYDSANGPIVRLYPDPRSVEQAYYRATGVFPPQHLVVLRRDAWEADKSLARRITDAFIACEAHFSEQIRSFPYASPWQELDLEAEDTLMGSPAYAHGLEPNRATLEQFCAEAHTLGLTTRLIDPTTYFAEYLAS
jgi:4,5-dihydroxyphthalate decarboxylase